MMWSQDETIRAYKFAAEAHNGQNLPGSELPYSVHPCLVSMEILAALRAEPGHAENLAVLAALLHDVLEDTAVPFDALQAAFGEPVARGVLALSKDKVLPKKSQMADSLERIRQQPVKIWMVKLANRITNLAPPPFYWTAEKIAKVQAEARQRRGARFLKHWGVPAIFWLNVYAKGLWHTRFTKTGAADSGLCSIETRGVVFFRGA